MLDPVTAGLPPVPASLLAPLLQGVGEALREMKAQDVPPAVRPLLGFDRRGFGSSSARSQLQRVLEAEAEFREEVFETFADRPEVKAVLATWDPANALDLVSAAAGRDDLALLTSALMASRPEGWELGVGMAAGMHERKIDEAALDDDRRAFDVQVQKADEARRRAEAERDEARDEIDRLAEELKAERAQRRSREEAVRAEADEAAHRVDGLERRLAQAERQAERAEERARREAERLSGVEEELAEARAEAVRERSEAVRARAEAKRASEVARRASEWLPADFAGMSRDEIEALRRLADGEPAAARGSGHERREAPSPTPKADAPEPDVREREAPSSEHPESADPPPAPAPARRTGQRPSAARRRVGLPPGIIGPSVEGLRAAIEGAGSGDPAVIVDGYNVSMQAWGDAPPDSQRQRLCALLERLHVRTNRSVTVVFDGAEVEGVRPPRRPGVRVVFSPADVEADDVVIAEVESLPADRPALVVSSDRWVCDEVEARGALAVPSTVFLEYLRK